MINILNKLDKYIYIYIYIMIYINKYDKSYKYSNIIKRHNKMKRS